MCERWTHYRQLGGKVILVVDHGSLKCGFYLEDKCFAIVFAGPSEKADDIIANGVGLYGESIVITADTELQSRCRRSSKSGINIMDPAKYIDDMETVSAWCPSDDGLDISDRIPLSLGEQITLGKLDDEIRLRGQLLDVEIQVGKKRKATNKKRKKLQTRIDRLRELLSLKGLSVIDRLTSVDYRFLQTEPSFNSTEQDLLLSRWQELRHGSNRREQTGDRIVYAEQLRRHIQQSESVKIETDSCDPSPAISFMKYINRHDFHVPTMADRTIDTAFPPTPSIPVNSYSPGRSTYELLSQANYTRLSAIKIVVVSDTHGFENQLTDSNNGTCNLPSGDVLVHLGDFALEGSHKTERRGLRQFDLWLARQPHKYKIVVRGNHDPLQCTFPESGAWYINKTSTTKIGPLRVAMIPYGSARNVMSGGKLPSECDILLSHVPPHKILDKTHDKKNAGSAFLSKVVRSMKDNAPKVWLCGHIHEGRGMKKHRFGSVETTVVNAANANSGRATQLAHGPVIVRIETDTKAVSVSGVKERTVGHIQASTGVFTKSDGRRNELLLAVDLGLKSGVSLYSSDGKLVRYEQFLFHRESLKTEIKKIIEQWEQDVANDTAFFLVRSIDKENPWKITHLAIEGGDVEILKAWSDAAPDLCITRISPGEWRSELLISKENASGADSKAAARLIARQIVADHGLMERHKGKLKTDVAESVLIGLFVSMKLGWIKRSPAIRRYSNGNIVVPR
eukprot:scaffold902_cov147-Cylindrotheca_fusiformis.AAC.6